MSNLKKGITIALSALIFLVIVVFVLYFSRHQAHPGMVSFDTVKYMSARREMTVRLLGSDTALKNEAVSVLARVERNTMNAINHFANGRVVVVKQALVVDGQVEDITDLVLEYLGLPTNATTIAPQSPGKILTPFSISEDYTEAKKGFEHWSEIERKQQQEADQFEQMVRQTENRREIDQYIP